MEQAANNLELGYWVKIRRTLDMIKFEHSVFALPFALTGALLAWRSSNFQIESLAWKLVWIILAMVSARSVAMTFNRLLDASIDAKNPRTAMRHIPSGQLSKSFAWAFLLSTATVFFLASALLNPLCLLLSPVALGVILFYSYTKRFTSLSHLVLGLSLGIAPAAAWIAITGQLDLRIGWLSAAVMLWTAGFDIIYACQDFDFDRRQGLFSIPASLGIARALWVSRALHLATVVCLLAAAQAFSLGPVAPAFVAALLLYEHSLVRANDLSRVNAAFFTVNGVIGAGFFAIHMIEVFVYVR